MKDNSHKVSQLTQLGKVLQVSVLASVLGLLSAPGFAADSELTSAIKQGQSKVARDLIRSGMNINAYEQDGTTALQWAIYNEQDDIVRALIRAEADVERSNREGISPLVLAAMLGNEKIAERLLDAGADVNRTLANGETPLMMAARTGDLETIELFLERGAEVNAREEQRGTTALMWAASYRNPQAIQLLLDKGADISLNSASTAPGRGPYLAPTARSRIRSFYRTIATEGAERTTQFGNVLDEESLEHVISRDELLARIPPALLKEFKEQNATDSGGGFRNNGGERRQWGGLTALHFAVREGDMASVKTLVEAGADVNQISEFGWSALLTATQNRYYLIGRYLLEHGANPNIANDGGWNPLYIATDNRNIEAGDYPTRKPDMDHLAYIKLLLAAGADPNLRMASSTETRTVFTNQWLNEDGATPFMRAAQSSDLELMRLLLEYGADPNIASRINVTALMLASGIAWVEGVTFEWSEQANEETIAMLIELGNDVNAQDSEDGRSALMGAAHKGRNYAVEMLVAAGANLDANDVGSRDSTNYLTGVQWRAIDYADGLVRVGVQSAEGHPETSALLRTMMLARGLEVPPEGRTIESICVVSVCQ